MCSIIIMELLMADGPCLYVLSIVIELLSCLQNSELPTYFSFDLSRLANVEVKGFWNSIRVSTETQACITKLAGFYLCQFTFSYIYLLLPLKLILK